MANILVVEDDSIPRKFLIDILRGAGHHTHEAVTAEEALAILGKSEIDLVITDVKLPGMSGVDFARRMREKYPQLPLIGISGGVSKETTYELAEAGVRAVFSKPLNRADFLAEIDRSLSGTGS